MGIIQKYECNGKYFRFSCDASEYSWQQSKNMTNISENYEIASTGDLSYGVYDRKNKELVASFPVIRLY